MYKKHVYVYCKLITINADIITISKNKHKNIIFDSI